MVHEIPAREVSAADNPPASSSSVAQPESSPAPKLLGSAGSLLVLGEYAAQGAYTQEDAFVRTGRVYAPAQGSVDAT